MTDTSIRISSENRDRLRDLKIGGETYDDVLARIMPEQGWTEEQAEEVAENVAFDPREHTIAEVERMVVDVDGAAQLSNMAELERRGEYRYDVIQAIESRMERFID